MKKAIKKMSAAVIVALLVLQCFPMTAFAYNGANYGAIGGNIGMGGTITAAYTDLATDWAVNYYSFTPTYSGWYSFYSSKTSGDPYFYLVQSGYQNTVYNSILSAGCQNSTAAAYSMAYNDDGNSNLNFLVSNYYLTGGTTYYLFLTKFGTARTIYYLYINRANSYYYVSYNANGGAGSMGSQLMYHHSNYALSSNAFTRDEYTFAGWNTSAAGTGTNYSAGQSVSNLYMSYGGTYPLYAKWTQNKYTVTLNRGTGTGGSLSVSAVYGAAAMPAITRPTAPAGHTFQGYYTGQNGTGTKYYNADGTSAHNFDFTTSTASKTKNTVMTLYAYYTQQEFTLTLNNQGGSGGNSAPLVYGAAYPASVTVPTRVGYVFEGYYGIDLYNVIDLANQYYNSDGTKHLSKSGNFTGTANVTVYAKWTNANVNLTVDLDGGEWRDWDGTTQNDTKDYSLLGNVQKAVTNTPTKTGAIFAGWTVTGNARFNEATKILTLDSTMSGTQTATLTANWNTPSALVTVPAGSSDGNKDALTELYNTDNLVTDPEQGITAEELSQSPTLELKVNPITAQDGEGEYGSAVEYVSVSGKHNYEVQSLINSSAGTVPESGAVFDVYVEKTVGTTTTRLKQVPSPVAVEIPLDGGLAGKTSYQVWHFHANTAEQLPEAKATDGLSGWFEFDNPTSPTKITVYLSTFSEIAVAYGEMTIDGSGVGSEAMLNNNGEGLDVQGKVLEGDSFLYKVDIAWGAMVFEFSKGALWDPDTHEYTAAAVNDWLPEGFTGGNNEITVENHSNGGLFVSFDIQPRTDAIPKNGTQAQDINPAVALEGVDFKVRMDNDDLSDEALNLPLPKVAYSGDLTAPSINAYVRLMGTPADVGGLADANEYHAEDLGFDYLRIAKVTVTLSPNAADGRTPMSAPQVPIP